MQWAYRRLHHVKPRLVLRGAARPKIWTFVHAPRAYSGHPSPPDAGSRTDSRSPRLLPPDSKATGDYRRSYDLVLKVLAPPKLDETGNRQPPAVPPLDQPSIYQLLQHVQEGMLPSRFATLEWPGSTEFWVDLLKKSLEHDPIMRDVWNFAQWWVREKGIKWPKFYETVLTYYLERGRLKEARRWHMKMAGTHAFNPDREAFANILIAFGSDPDKYMQALLNGIYSLSKHRDLYDLVIPTLYGRGMSVLAIRWHGNFCHRKDYPQTLASQAFVVFLRAYFPQTYKISLPAEFHATESDGNGTEVAEETGSGNSGSNQAIRDRGAGHGGPSADGLEDVGSPSDPADDVVPPQSPPPKKYVPRATSNTVYGQIFGISEKEYNDSLGARWFASKWVPLDTAISIVHGLGVEQIGPLSLQSIAIREASWEDIARRLDQLRSLGVGVVECNYTTLLKRLTQARNQEHLTTLLQSDMHPDAFEDLNLLAKVKQSREAEGDIDGAKFWDNARDILSGQRVNHLIQVLYKQNHLKTIDVLDDLAASNLTLSRETLDGLVVQMHKTLNVEAKPSTRSFAQFHINLFMRLLRLAAPLPADTWTRLFFSLGRDGHLDLLEDLALGLSQHILDTRSRPGFIAVSPNDIPPVARAARDLGRRRLRVPNDLPSRHEWHPLNLIFTSKLQSAIVRWGVSQSLTDPRTRPRESFDPRKSVFLSGGVKPAEFFIARGIRLLRLLKDRGLFIIDNEAISKRIILRLAELYGPEIRFKVNHRVAREVNTFTMAEFVGICDEAWGEKLLPPDQQLVELVKEFRIRHEKGHNSYIKRKGIVVRKTGR